MAKIKLGSHITDISGSIAKTIYTRTGRSRHAIKSRAGIYSNPSSTLQAQIRNWMQEASSVWRDDLTPDQRKRWDAYASTLKRRDGLGGNRNLIRTDASPMSGYHAFVSAYVNYHRCGIVSPIFVDEAPIGQTPPSAVLTGGTASWVPAVTPNYALDFDGVDEYIDVGNVLPYEFNQPQAWGIWVYTRQPTVANFVVSKMGPGLQNGYQVVVQSKVIFFQILRFLSGEGIWVSRAFDVPDGWHYIICTYDGSNNANGMRIYVDNVVGQAVAGNTPMTGTITTPRSIFFAGDPLFPGVSSFVMLDCIHNFNKMLTAPNVATLWNGGAGRYGANPLSDGSCQGAWMFCTGHNHILYDISGNGYNGALKNMEPGDWVPGHVPCPHIPGHIEFDWQDPVIVTANSKIRVWIRSRELGVHKQLISNVDLGPETLNIFQVRMAQGLLHDITDFPGHYLLQADVFQPNGLKSPPSHTVEVTVP